MTGIAGNTDFCSLNEKHCTSCKGHSTAIHKQIVERTQHISII